ncbi:MAG: hypothetical protein K2K24_01290 [Clostridia bacterium]|nr:hypothetical protein [Clostridia bacterium]
MAKDNDNIHTNHRDRMRQRIAKDGLDSLQDHELLEYILYAFIPRKDTNPIAHKLLNTFGSLENVFNTSVEMLMSIPNMTYSASLFLTSMPSIIKRYNLQKLGDKIVIKNTNEAMEYFKNVFAEDMEEQFQIAIVSPDGRVVDKGRISKGDTDQCKLDIKKFILRTASTQAKDFFIAHNHPSGDPSPSLTDYEFTKWVTSLATTLELRLVDHIIVARNGCFSFRRDGAIATYKDDFERFCKYTPVNDKYRK